MSIEKALADVAEALRENSELLKGLTASAKSGGTAKATTKAKDEDGDGEGEGEKPTRKRTAKAKVPTAKELSTATTNWLEVDDEDEYERRKGIVKKIVAKFDAAKMSEVEEGDRAEALELLNQAIDGKNPFKKARDEDDDVA